MIKRHEKAYSPFICNGGTERLQLGLPADTEESAVRPTNVETGSAQYRLAANHWTDVSKIRDEPPG